MIPPKTLQGTFDLIVSTMKHSVSMLIGASLLFGFTWAYNFDDQNRLLQRTRDMQDATPMTKEEGQRLRSLIEGGRIKVKGQRNTGVPKKHEDAKDYVTRRLKKDGSGSAKHEERGARLPRGSTATTRAKDSTPKKEKKTKAIASETTRSKPVESTRKKGHHDSSAPKDTGRKKTKTSRHDPVPTGSYTDDYFYSDDEVYYIDQGMIGAESGGGLTYVFMYMEAFQDVRNIAPGIPPNPARPDEFNAGTLYIFNNEPVYGVIYDQFSGNSTTGITVDESDLVAEVTGQCVRTDPNDQLDTENYVGRAYCQFVYTSTGLVDDVFTAEGPIQIGEDAILPVTGGRGVYRRTVGEIILTPVDDSALTSSPPSIEFNYDLDLPSSYYLQAYIYMDVSLLPPEVLS